MAARTSPPRVVVVGGGPAGLMAAETVAAAGIDVTVLERMPSLGRRFLMAGRGGLNITHTEPLDAFVARYGPEAAWLRPLIEAFTPYDLRAWCAGLGIETFAGSSGRVFPIQMKTSPLLRAWVSRLEASGVRLRTRAEWLGLDAEGVRVAGDQAPIPADAVILACGGATWPRLGANGAWVERLGLPVTPLAPANGGFTVAWSAPFLERFAGQPLKGAAMRVGETTSRGEAIVTAQGIEGGGVYALSRPLRAALAEGAARLTLDLAPDRTEARLAARLAAAGRQSLSNRLRRAGLSPLKAGLLREGHGTALARDPAPLAAAIKAVPLTVTGTTGMARAISTAGGLPLDALDPRLMIRARPGVFACGEMLDWEAPTGGYLLTACLATGRAAGKGAVAWLRASHRRGETAAADVTAPRD